MPLHLSEVDRVLISQSFEDTSTPPCPSKTLMPGSWTPEPVGPPPLQCTSRDVRCEKHSASERAAPGQSKSLVTRRTPDF